MKKIELLTNGFTADREGRAAGEPYRLYTSIFAIKAEIRPCENILCPKDISEKRNRKSLMFNADFFERFKPALSPTDRNLNKT